MRAATLALMAVVLGACDGDPLSYDVPQAEDSAGQPICAERTGTFLARYREQPGGTCGPLRDSVALLTGLAGAGTPGVICAGTVASSTACVGASSVECAAPGDQVMHYDSAARWAADGQSGEGILRLEDESADPSRACVSFYAVTFTAYRE